MQVSGAPVRSQAGAGLSPDRLAPPGHWRRRCMLRAADELEARHCHPQQIASKLQCMVLNCAEVLHRASAEESMPRFLH